MTNFSESVPSRTERESPEATLRKRLDLCRQAIRPSDIVDFVSQILSGLFVCVMTAFLVFWLHYAILALVVPFSVILPSGVVLFFVTLLAKQKSSRPPFNRAVLLSVHLAGIFLTLAHFFWSAGFLSDGPILSNVVFCSLALSMVMFSVSFFSFRKRT